MFVCGGWWRSMSLFSAVWKTVWRTTTNSSHKNVFLTNLIKMIQYNVQGRLRNIHFTILYCHNSIIWSLLFLSQMLGLCFERIMLLKLKEPDGQLPLHSNQRDFTFTDANTSRGQAGDQAEGLGKYWVVHGPPIQGFVCDNNSLVIPDSIKLSPNREFIHSQDVR